MTANIVFGPAIPALQGLDRRWRRDFARHLQCRFCFSRPSFGLSCGGRPRAWIVFRRASSRSAMRHAPPGWIRRCSATSITEGHFASGTSVACANSMPTRLAVFLESDRFQGSAACLKLPSVGGGTTDGRLAGRPGIRAPTELPGGRSQRAVEVIPIGQVRFPPHTADRGFYWGSQPWMRRELPPGGRGTCAKSCRLAALKDGGMR